MLVLYLFLFLGVQNIGLPKEVNYNYLPLLADSMIVEMSWKQRCENGLLIEKI